MRISTASTLVALSSLALLATSPFGGNSDHGSAVVSARLTPQDRIRVEAKDPDNPNYCPACLQKAMHNHFPHACSENMDPAKATTRPEGPLPDEQRCVCLSFMDLYWMKLDCDQECEFVHDAEAMSQLVHASDIPGCDNWINFESGEDKIVEGFAQRDPNHRPEVFSSEPVEEEQVLETKETKESTEPADSEKDVKEQQKGNDEENDVKEKQEDIEVTQVQLEEPKIAEVNKEDLKVQQSAKEKEASEEKEANVEEEAKEKKEAKVDEEAKDKKEVEVEKVADEKKEAEVEESAEEKKEAKADEVAEEKKEAKADEVAEEKKEAKADGEAEERKEAKVEEEVKEEKEANAEKEAKEKKQAKVEKEVKDEL